MSNGESAPQHDEHRPGDTVRDGRFAITGKLGEGGQGTTFDAVDKRDGRRVTIKRFRVRGASSWKEVELAEREAKVLAGVDHPHLPVYVDHFEEGGSLYLVTEHIEGQTVARLREGGPVGEAEVLRFLADAADALDYLHGRSPPLVHRDIKPSNVIRRPDGSFAIIDFGAVRNRLKATGSTVVGTFGYMAPEQFQGRSMPASDVYAVGATAIAMLSGAEPEDLPHKGLAIDVAAALPGARPALVRALAAMVEPDPDRRAATISPLLGELRARRPAADPPPRADDATSQTPGPDWTVDRELQREMNEAGEQVKRAAAEIGQTFLRVVDEVSKGSAKDLEREARRAAEIARRAVKEAKREAHRARDREREARNQARDHERAARKQERAARDREREPRGEDDRRVAPRPRGAPLGGPVLLVVLLALTAAQLAVLLALRVVTPIVLYVVSALFFGSVPGRAMRAAAGAVSQAGKRAVAAMGRAKDVVRGRAPVDPAGDTQVKVTHDPQADPHAPTHISTIERAGDEPQRARIDGAPGGDRPRVDDDTRAEEEAAAEEEARGRDERRRG